MSLTSFFLKYESCLSGLFAKCGLKPSVNEEQEKLVIDKGSKQLEEDFNYKTLMDRMRLCEYETTQLEMSNTV